MPTREVDVIVLARGGGSPEDLLPFSDEVVCRAVAACATPVVSAIGHEQDNPLVDLVADARAGTPSLAARMVVPDHAALLASLDALLTRGARASRAGPRRPAARSSCSCRDRPSRGPRPGSTSAESALAAQRRPARPRACAPARARVGPGRAAHGRLRVLGPAATLERGYAIVQDEAGAVFAIGGRLGRRPGRRAPRPRPARRARRGDGRVTAREPTFEEARDELEEIVRKLEDGRTSLDEAITLWERGEALHALCRAKLDAAEGRVAELLERLGRSPDGGDAPD